jgi:hypothetical protein
MDWISFLADNWIMTAALIVLVIVGLAARVRRPKPVVRLGLGPDDASGSLPKGSRS